MSQTDTLSNICVHDSHFPYHIYYIHDVNSTTTISKLLLAYPRAGSGHVTVAW